MARYGLLLLIALAPALAGGEEVTWKRHALDPRSEFPACAAFDVDRDGDLDIFSGGWWYEAPTWERHKVRDVDVIRGRFDDYSNLPLDCNGDGWTDVISVNYRSEAIYWIEHPGERLGRQHWTVHRIDKPGHSETGRLHDLDGDGDLDILPNGTDFAAWYEFAPEKLDGGGQKPVWIRRELPKEAAGHGIGVLPARAGMPATLVTPRGLVRPAESPQGRWLFEPFELKVDLRRTLHADASVPIVSLPHGGTYRLCWGRGHRTGLYSRIGQSMIEAIDTSWSQCHAPLVADIDGDGQLDLVAGKRYLGHEGKDPGELDPLVLYWYQYVPEHGTWRRHAIEEAGPAGIDLDGKVVDLDGDGDIDVIAPSRHGLYWYENLRVNKQEVAADRRDEQRERALDAYKNHRQLLVVADGQGDLKPVKTPAEWGLRRWHIVQSMERVMGKLPNSEWRVPFDGGALKIEPQASRSEKYDTFQVTLQSEPQTPARPLAALLVPKERGERPLPAMLCLHPTSIHGRKVVTGEVEIANRNYAHEMAERGYVCICPDYPTMGQNPFDLPTTHKHFQSGTMVAIWDNVRCLDLLESLTVVDGDRIGVIGHSLGGHNGLFTACFDQRIKCIVTSCGFTPFHDYYGGKLAGWTQDRYMPRIRDVYGSDPDKMPFDFYEVLGALAPRPVFINAPLHDDNFEVGGVRKAVAEAQQVYDLLGQPKHLAARYPDCGHDFPPEIREEVYKWLDENLK